MDEGLQSGTFFRKEDNSVWINLVALASTYYAIDDLLKGNEITIKNSEPFGCRIFYRGIIDKMR